MISLSLSQTRFMLLLLDPYYIPLWGKDAAEAPSASQAAGEGRAGKGTHSKGLLGGPAQHTCLILWTKSCIWLTQSCWGSGDMDSLSWVALGYL